jgi:hypothetical protein
VLPSDFSAKGSLLAGTGAGTYSALGVGANGLVLQANSACSTGLEWVTAQSAITSAYGQFSSSITQVNLDIVNGNAATFNTTSFNQFVTVNNGSEVTLLRAGVYNIQISIQVSKTDSGTDTFTFWFKKNGVNIPDSSTNLTMEGNNNAQLASLNLLESFSVNDYIEVWWHSLDANVRLLAASSTSPYPATPSIILTVTPVGA